MLYKDLVKHYDGRKKGRDFKVMWSGAARLTMTAENDVFVSTVTQYRFTAGKRDFVYDAFLKVTPENKLYVLRDVNGSSIGNRNRNRNVFDKVAGFGYAQSSTASYGNHKYKQRFKVGYGANTRIDVPFGAGLVLDLANRSVVAHPEDVIRTTDRKAARDVYKHVPRVLQVMDVLWRIGDLVNPYENNSASWQFGPAARGALQKVSPDLDDEALAEQAEKAFKASAVVQGGYRKYKWTYNQKLKHQERTELTEPEYKAEWYDSVRRRAERMIREQLKQAHDCFKKEVIPAKIENFVSSTT